jgi:hypothetical protein
MSRKADLRKADQQQEALHLVVEILVSLGSETRAKGSHSGAIGGTGRHVFRALAKRKGAFARPLPFRRDELPELTSCSKSAIAAAIPQLIKHGFLTITGLRTAPMVMLYLPTQAIAEFERRQEKLAAGIGAIGNGRHYAGLWSVDVMEALQFLDEDQPIPLY